MTLRFQPVQVGTEEGVTEGLLVFNDLILVAVLGRLSDLHDNDAGRWFLEVGFGRLDHPRSRTFADLDAAQAWIMQQLLRAVDRF